MLNLESFSNMDTKIAMLSLMFHENDGHLSGHLVIQDVCSPKTYMNANIQYYV